MTKKPEHIPTGTDHISMVLYGFKRIEEESVTHFPEYRDQLRLIGICLNVLYQAATCHRECHGSGHVLERLCGRAYNLACGAFQLSTMGLYDESLNLIRALGELTNLVTLSMVDPPRIQEWLNADVKKREREFGPVKVRLMLEAKGFHIICADKDWYKQMSESYIHITPQTDPNRHDGGVGFIGGKYQADGANKTLDELQHVLGYLSMLVAKFFKFDDLYANISEEIDNGRSLA